MSNDGVRRNQLNCKRCKPRVMTYVQFFIDGHRRQSAGQRQVRCPACGLYRWPDEIREVRPRGTTVRTGEVA